jgi:hypothetical protein
MMDTKLAGIVLAVKIILRTDCHWSVSGLLPLPQENQPAYRHAAADRGYGSVGPLRLLAVIQF